MSCSWPEGKFKHIGYLKTKAEAIASRSEWEKNHVTN
jgi:hypothetical protein